MRIAGFEIPSDSPAFVAVLAIHIPLGVLAVVSGLGAMLKEKGSGGHIRFGRIYVWSLTALFLTATVLAIMRWSEDYHLFVLGAAALAAAFVGREARRRRWSMRLDPHVVGMGVSYIAMLTAFYVDNGKNLPLWRDLPYLAYWLTPGVVGIPLIVWALTCESKLGVRAGGAAH